MVRKPLYAALEEFANNIRGLVEDAKAYNLDLGPFPLEWEDNDAVVLHWFASGEWTTKVRRLIKQGKPWAKELQDALINMDMSLTMLLDYYGVDQPFDVEGWEELLERW